MSRGAIEQAKWRRRNAVHALNDALVELRVADRLLREAKGLPIERDATRSGVASDPAGASVPVLAGSAGRMAGGPIGGAMADSVTLVWPPEWQR